MSDENERSVASAGSMADDRDILTRLRDWRSVHLARLHEVMEQAAGEIELLRGYRNEAESEALIASLAVERLRLTDAEREAIQWAAGQARLFPEFHAICGHADALRGLLERLGGGG